MPSEAQSVAELAQSVGNLTTALARYQAENKYLRGVIAQHDQAIGRHDRRAQGGVETAQNFGGPGS